VAALPVVVLLGLLGLLRVRAPTQRWPEAEASALIRASRREVERRGEGLWLIATEWASAVLFNGLGRYEDALAAAEQAAEDPHEPGVSTWVPTEIIYHLGKVFAKLAISSRSQLDRGLPASRPLRRSSP
jgi:hypothetical protein